MPSRKEKGDIMNVELVKFKVGVTDDVANGQSLKKGIELLEQINIKDFKITQSGTNKKWYFEGMKRHDVDQQLSSMPKEELFRLAKEKQVIVLQEQFRNELLSCLGHAKLGKLSQAKSNMIKELQELGIPQDKIDAAVLKAFK